MKTKADVFRAMLEMIGDKAAPGRGKDYADDILKIFGPKMNPNFRDIKLSDEDYVKELAAMKAELPAILAYLGSMNSLPNIQN